MTISSTASDYTQGNMSTFLFQWTEIDAYFLC